MSFAPVGPTSEWGLRISQDRRAERPPGSGPQVGRRSGGGQGSRERHAQDVVQPSPSRAAPTWLSTTRANSAGMRSRALRSPDQQRHRCGSRMTIECTGTINLQDADFDL